MTEPCPRDLSQRDGRAVLGHTMAGPLCLVLLGTSLAGLLLPGGSGKRPLTLHTTEMAPGRRRDGGGQSDAPKSPRWGERCTPCGVTWLGLVASAKGSPGPGVPPSCGWGVRRQTGGHTQKLVDRERGRDQERQKDVSPPQPEQAGGEAN